jgi:hypothetical protein
MYTPAQSILVFLILCLFKYKMYSFLSLNYLWKNWHIFRQKYSRIQTYHVHQSILFPLRLQMIQDYGVHPEPTEIHLGIKAETYHSRRNIKVWISFSFIQWVEIKHKLIYSILTCQISNIWKTFRYLWRSFAQGLQNHCLKPQSRQRIMASSVQTQHFTPAGRRVSSKKTV